MPSEWHHCGGNYFIDGFVYHLSHDCHKDIDHNISTMYCRSSSSDDSINLLNRRRPTHGLHKLFLQKLGENGQQKYRAMLFYCSKGCTKKFRQLWLEQKNRHNTRIILMSNSCVSGFSLFIYTTMIVRDWCIMNHVHGWWVSIQGIAGIIRGGNGSLSGPLW